MSWKTTVVVIVSLLITVMFGAQVAGAEETAHKWQEYTKDLYGLTYYYDKDNITFPSAGVLKVWRKRDFPVRAGQKSIISLDEIDCFRQKYRSVHIEVIRWDDTIEAHDKIQDWMTIWGETSEEWFLDNTCKEVRKKK